MYQQVLAAKTGLHRSAKYTLHAQNLHSAKMASSVQQSVCYCACFEDFFAEATIQELGIEEIGGIIKVVIFAGDVRNFE